MKKKKLFALWAITLITVFTLVCGYSANVFADEDPKTDLPDDYRARYTPSQERIVTGYRVEHYGFIGGAFSRIVKEYSIQPCCKFTGSMMDGCSGLRNCSTK